MIKRRVGSQIENLTLDHEHLKARSNDLQLGHAIHH